MMEHNNHHPTLRQRKMSVSSGLFSLGSWPDSSDVRHQMISCIMYFHRLPDKTTVKNLLENSLLKYYKFRSVPMRSSSGSLYWQEVEISDVDEFLYEHDVDGEEQLSAAIDRLISRSYRKDRPRWEFHFLRNRSSGGDSVVVYRFDHCIGDGVSMVEVCGDLLTDLQSRPLPRDELRGLCRRHPQKPAGSSSPEPHCRLVVVVVAFLKAAVLRAMNSLVTVVKTAIQCSRAIYATLTATSGPYDYCPGFNTWTERFSRTGVKVGPAYKLAKSPPIRLDYVRETKALAGVTVNDVLLAAFAGTIRRYHGQHCTKADSEQRLFVRALLPYAFPRSPSAYANYDDALKNRFAVTPIELAVNERTARARLRKTTQLVQHMKAMYLPYVIYAIQTFIGLIMPTTFLRETAGSLFARHSVVFANVPGYGNFCRFAGEKVHEVQVAFCSVLPQVEVLSYAGQLFFNIVASEDAFSDVYEIPKLFVEELKAIGDAYGVKSDILHAIETTATPVASQGG